VKGSARHMTVPGGVEDKCPASEHHRLSSANKRKKSNEKVGGNHYANQINKTLINKTLTKSLANKIHKNNEEKNVG